jgi:hypothetical protein
MKQMALALTVVCLVLVAAACGAGDGAESAGPAPSVPVETEPAASAAAETGTTVPRDSAVGFIGLPPEGATPSTPESGKLVGFWWGPGPGNAWRGRYWLYEDGRLIVLGEGDIPEGANRYSTGFLEQRLTPEGVELVRSGTPPYLGLPASAWEDREFKAYVPSRYAVCYGSWPADWPIERSVVLTWLPPAAEKLLRHKPKTAFDLELMDGPAGEITPVTDICSEMTTEEARALVKVLEDEGLEPEGFQGTTISPTLDTPEEQAAAGAELTYHLAYRFNGPGSVQGAIYFEPILPDGHWTCSPCG